MQGKSTAVVLGGGISGLAVARHLAINGYKVKVLEKSSRIGGWVTSERLQSGVLFEKGPHSMRPRTRGNGLRIVELVQELGLEEETLCSKGTERYVFAKGKLTRLPSNLKEVFSNPLTMNIPPRVALEAISMSFVQSKDAILGEFIQRKFGGDAKLMISAMVSGIFAGDVDKLSVKSCFPEMIKYNTAGMGSFTRGMFLAPKDTSLSSAKSSRLAKASGITFADGMSRIVNVLTDECTRRGVEMIGDYPVQALSHDASSNMWTIQSIQSGSSIESSLVVSTLAPKVLRKVLVPDNRLQTSLMVLEERIGKVDVAVVNMYYNSNDVQLPPRGFGHLVAEKELQAKTGALGVIYDSNAFPEQQPPGVSVVSVMLGGAHAPWISEKSEVQLIDLACKALLDHMYVGLRPLEASALLHKDCIPQYRLGHSEAALSVRNQAGKDNLVLLGTGFLGAGIADSVGGALNYMETEYGMTKRS